MLCTTSPTSCTLTLRGGAVAIVLHVGHAPPQGQLRWRAMSADQASAPVVDVTLRPFARERHAPQLPPQVQLRATGGADCNKLASRIAASCGSFEGSRMRSTARLFLRLARAAA